MARIGPTPQKLLPVLALLGATLPATAGAQSPTLEELSALRFRHIGPVGNRVVAVAGVPGDDRVYYAGAASGGLWKTEDGGLTWEPVFDDQPVHSVGALAVAPSDPNVVYAGTGEPFIRSNVSIGDGVWKSTDAGDTWERVGLEGSGRISRIVVHPTDPDVAWAAALGHAYAPQQERGVFRTTDGGATWERVLFVDENTGASDLVMDPTNPRILYAGMWQIDIKTWGRVSGGPGSGLFRSTDGGESWTRLEGSGLPELPVGKVAVCMSAEDPERVYALIETGDGVSWHGRDHPATRGAAPESGELWRSDDAGATWRVVNHSRDLAGRQAYYTRCAAAPDDPDEVYFLVHSYFVTKDGGETYEEATGASEPIWDHHDMWIDPTDPDRQAVAGDGGVAISRNRGKTWFRVQLPIAQMYHVTADNAVPYNVLGNRQDGPSFRGPSNSRDGSRIPRGAWREVGGGESGFATPDPTDHRIVWSSASGAGAAGGIVTRWDERTGQFRHVEVWPESTLGWPAGDLRYRFQWTFPLLVSPHDHTTVYVTSQHVHRTTNGGQSWEVISPDLTTDDESRQGISGGLTPDNIGVEYCCVIYAFDESPVEAGVLWAGTNDGLVHVSRDGGGNWTEVTDDIPGLPADGVVRSVDASRHAPGKAYITVERHAMGDFAPYAYRTSDYGRSWTRITSGVPEHPLSYTRYLLEDPVRPGLLYLGTEGALYVSFDDGGSWRSLMTNLPPAPVYGLVVQEHFDDLVVGTYGRGFWILDDVTPLQQLTPEVAAADAHLFRPRAAYRFRSVTDRMTMFDDWSDGENPEYGASLNYWLGDGEVGSAELRITDAGGRTVRTLEGTTREGLNRVRWDLEDEPSTRIRLRTKPLHADWVDLGDDGWRSGGGGMEILQPPGTYTVTLVVDGREAGSVPLEVRKDPHSEGTMADIRAQLAMLEELRDDLDTAAGIVNRIEWMRRQLHDLQPVLAARDDDALVAAAASLDTTLIAVEDDLVQLRNTGTGQDGVRWPTKLVGRLGYLANVVATADFPPTDQAREVQRALEERLRATEVEFRSALSAVEAFNRRLAERGLGPVVTEVP